LGLEADLLNGLLSVSREVNTTKGGRKGRERLTDLGQVEGVLEQLRSHPCERAEDDFLTHARSFVLAEESRGRGKD